MVKKLVIYNSKTGFTKKYAEWIAEGSAADIRTLKEAKRMELFKYEVIVFGSWCMGGSLAKLKWFANKLKSLQNKKVAIYACGASPNESPEIDGFLKTGFADEVFKNARVFYCQGGLNYNKMGIMSKTAMRIFAKMVNNKKDKTQAEEEMAKMICRSYDITDRKYADEVVSWIEGASNS
ncbi:MAG TPA: flavodoxin domain-containing protein [Bacillota bacterium]|nr:flavodoxin domain-containing protein [Bacillota bacterium]